MNNEIMVSIDVLVYKQESYLRKCLDSLVCQKTDFKFEILVHDDASPDNSPSIIKEYEEKYPELIVPIYQIENQYSKRVNMSWTYQFPRARGKYIAFCEGDDYWIDENKLQKQFDIMEAHPECVMCTHMVQAVDETDSQELNTMPAKKMREGVYNEREWLELVAIGHPFQTTCYFIKAEILKDCLKEGSRIPEFINTMPVGDKALGWLGISRGKLYYTNEIMSHYRSNAKGSWSERTAKDREYGVAYREKIIKASEEFNEYTNYVFDDIIQDEILDRELTIELIKQNYRNTLSKKYRKYFKRFSLRTKAVCVVGAMFPCILKRH